MPHFRDLPRSRRWPIRQGHEAEPVQLAASMIFAPEWFAATFPPDAWEYR